MTIRVRRKRDGGGRGGPEGGALGNINGGSPAAKGDDWSNRVVKLIPAEALGLFGTGSTLTPNPGDKHHTLFIWLLAIACLCVTILFRYIATRDDNGKPQIVAILIASISFVLWFLTMKPPMGIDLGLPMSFVALAALVWATVVPTFYKGD